MAEKDAMELVRELQRASTDYTKRINSTGRGLKGAHARENRAMVQLFKALTGALPTGEQVDWMAQ